MKHSLVGAATGSLAKAAKAPLTKSSGIVAATTTMSDKTNAAHPTTLARFQNERTTEASDMALVSLVVTVLTVLRAKTFFDHVVEPTISFSLGSVKCGRPVRNRYRPS